MKIAAMFIAIFIVSTQAFAQQVVDANKAKFSWTYSGPIPSEFRIKCGPASKQYTRVITIADGAARSATLSGTGLGNGSFYCIITAFNGLESTPSGEIFFAAVVAASTPGSFSIGE